jgi:single-stranded-DNA-specific exonuclease
LTGENRMLVRGGLERLRWGLRQGLVSLAQAAGLTVARISATDIGFGLGPRLNAAGRLDSALAAYQLLVDDNLFSAGRLAQILDDQNRNRQKLTQEMQMAAETQICSAPPSNLMFAADGSFNSGVVGLVAAKITEMYYRPAVIAQIGEEFTRASCRSIPEFHITAALDECGHLLERHGGHAMAAGFTVRNERVPELVNCLKQIADQQLSDRDLRPSLRADVEIPLCDLHPNYLGLLDKLQPTGMENPDAVFVTRNLRVVRAKQVGSDAKHLKLAVSDGRITFDAIAFRMGHWYGQLPERIDLLYHFESNQFNGQVSLQLNVKDLKPSGQPD